MESEDDDETQKTNLEEEEDSSEEDKYKRSELKSGDLFASSDSEGEDVADILGGKIQEKSTFEKRQERVCNFGGNISCFKVILDGISLFKYMFIYYFIY